MESKHKIMLGICILMALAALYLFDVYAPHYLLPLYLLLLTWPLVFAAGRNWEKHVFENYLDYLREVGDLQDFRGATPAPKREVQQAPQRPFKTARRVPLGDMPLPVREETTVQRSRLRQRPPRH